MKITNREWSRSIVPDRLLDPQRFGRRQRNFCNSQYLRDELLHRQHAVRKPSFLSRLYLCDDSLKLPSTLKIMNDRELEKYTQQDCTRVRMVFTRELSQFSTNIDESIISESNLKIPR